MTTNIYQPVAEEILTILRRKAVENDDVHLQLHLEAAMWESAAMQERRKTERLENPNTGDISVLSEPAKPRSVPSASSTPPIPAS